MKRHNKISKGFTLLEVLVASVILFAAVALVSVIYSNVVSTSLKAERAIKITSTMPILVESVANKLQLNTGKTTEKGEGQIDDVTFNWQANKEQSSPMLVNDIDEITSQHNISLWSITLNIQYRNIIRTYNYREFSIE